MEISKYNDKNDLRCVQLTGDIFTIFDINEINKSVKIKPNIKLCWDIYSGNFITEKMGKEIFNIDPFFKIVKINYIPKKWYLFFKKKKIKNIEIEYIKG